MLGLIAHQGGHNDQAIGQLRQARALRPDDAGRTSIWASSYVLPGSPARRFAVPGSERLEPESAEILSNCGDILMEWGN